MIKAGIKTAVTYTWGYAAGEELVDGFKQSFLKGGGKIIKELRLPFPNVEFQAGLAEIASLKPQAVYSFYAGGGALKFMQDFAAAGLKNSIQLWGPGFLTDGVESKVGEAGNGVKTAAHYVVLLDNAENKKFRADYNAAFKMFPDVYAGAGLGHDASARYRPEGRGRRRVEAGRALQGDARSEIQFAARALPPLRFAEPDSQSSICANCRTARTSFSGLPRPTSPIRPQVAASRKFSPLNYANGGLSPPFAASRSA